MRAAPDLPPAHRLVRGGIASAGALVLLAVAILFASSALPEQLWSACVSFVDGVRGLWWGSS